MVDFEPKEYENIMNHNLIIPDFYGEKITCGLDVQQYTNNNSLAILIYCLDNENIEEFTDMTVNLSMNMPGDDFNYAFINNNDIKEMEQIIQDWGLGEPTGITEQSGFCKFPLYKFNEKRLNEVTDNRYQKVKDNYTINKINDVVDRNRNLEQNLVETKQKKL